MPSIEQLKELQSKSLEEKIQISIARIIEWYERWEGQVYISFSGGKDSTVLLDLVRRIYPDVPAVFCDTGLEYPEIREFVKTFNNVEWLKPKKNFKEIIIENGYPIISKEISRDICTAKNKPDGKTAQKFNPDSPYSKKYGERWCLNKYAYLLNSFFKISNKCCNIMKKDPMHLYNKKTGRKPFIGTQTNESALRKQNWLKSGCNAFQSKNPQSSPLSFWSEQDILHYIKKFNLAYSSVYGELVEDKNKKMRFTGCQRTGCVFCGYGCQLDKIPNRFQRLALTHPALYNYCINGGEFVDGVWQPSKTGLGMGKVLDYIGVDYKPLQNQDQDKT